LNKAKKINEQKQLEGTSLPIFGNLQIIDSPKKATSEVNYGRGSKMEQSEPDQQDIDETDILPLKQISLEDLLKTPVMTKEHVLELDRQFKISQNNFNSDLYGLFYPLVRVKGHIFKMQKMKINHYPRYLYINPIEGKVVSYDNLNKFPH
jgi:hypothetical protein